MSVPGALFDLITCSVHWTAVISRRIRFTLQNVSFRRQRNHAPCRRRTGHYFDLAHPSRRTLVHLYAVEVAGAPGAVHLTTANTIRNRTNIAPKFETT